MKNSVIIKSFPSGIVLHLDDEIPFDDLLSDIAEKFRESSGFFKDAKMALSIRGRSLSEDSGCNFRKFPAQYCMSGGRGRGFDRFCFCKGHQAGGAYAGIRKG